ncbi:MAG: YedE family putative selenium transporter [Saccharofermentanales bacterium]|jgi:YedE family putative selenium metabolism protein
MLKKKNLIMVIIAGLVIGFAGVFLMTQGNPANMGFCIACFLRDTAGSLKLHTAPVVQYARPEIMGIIFGSFAISLIMREFKPRGGSSPLTRFVLGFLVMVGALVFLGCPLRMVLRMAAGDLNAWIGLIGFILGVYIGTLFLKRGFSLGRTYKKNALEGAFLPVLQIVLFIMVAATSSLLAFSEKGPGSMHASVWVALIFSLIVGILAQRSRLCQAGGFRDMFMLRDAHLFWGNVAIFGVALIYNLIIHKVNFSLYQQPVAHSEWIWNIVGLMVVGLGSVLLGGCPMRQLVLTGTGNVDSALTVIGFVVGAAFCHNFGWASGPDQYQEATNIVTGGGTTPGGRIAVLIALALMIVIGFVYSKKQQTQTVRK